MSPSVRQQRTPSTNTPMARHPTWRHALNVLPRLAALFITFSGVTPPGSGEGCAIERRLDLDQSYF